MTTQTEAAPGPQVVCYARNKGVHLHPQPPWWGDEIAAARNTKLPTAVIRSAPNNAVAVTRLEGDRGYLCSMTARASRGGIDIAVWVFTDADLIEYLTTRGKIWAELPFET